MKAYSIALAALVLMLSLILSTWLNKAQAEGRPMASSSSVSAMAPSSQAFENLHRDEKHPFEKVNSSFRRIPPSISNPIQNKFNHP
ncbi:Transmembrane protein [Melia azedarach]|uniref:Transmembrane protein n=1 Tax=Melia azedarach TaxID=155640 RepID=A0ACC1Y2N7_MELAZ|nr:Transmembrane protein [Melia azedarach]